MFAGTFSLHVRAYVVTESNGEVVKLACQIIQSGRDIEGDAYFFYTEDQLLAVFKRCFRLW